MTKQSKSRPERRPAKDLNRFSNPTEKNSMPRYKNPPSPPPKKKN